MGINHLCFLCFNFRQTEDIRSIVKEIIERQQLEFVTGGWVMPDEAVTSNYATIDQLIEGHQWLQHFVGVLPEHGWSVDVFGHSASYPYILSSAGISKIVIMRTHYAWKKFLAQNQSFDFYWEQPFPSPKVLCHMAPSDLYSFKYACGPDPVICLKFDFRRVDREYSESTADKITNENVEIKASYLLSQYGRFASLLPHNVLLVPLGDDFRYNVKVEWIQQLENYKKLFNYINNRKDWNAHVSFGTVSDYFREVNKRLHNTSKILHSIEGDFLPYADIYANFRPSYWTGFYTTRPIYKKMSKELEYWLRTSEILYSLAKSLISSSLQKIIDNDYAFLISARQKLGLFQHHDAITGTSKEIVMRDYMQKLHAAIIDAMSVASHITQLLLLEQTTEGKTWTSQIYPDVYRSSFDQPTQKLSISILGNGRKVIIFNSLTVHRLEVVSINVKSPLLKVIDSDQIDVPFQINPVFRDEFAISNTAFELLFLASLKPLSYTTYTIVKFKKGDQDTYPKTVVSLSLNNDVLSSHVNSAFTFEKSKSRNLIFESSKIRATFSHTGQLENIYLKEHGISKSLGIDFLSYVPWIYRSGAYLFCPESNNARSVRNSTTHFPLLSVIQGPLVSELNIVYHNFLKFSARLYHFENAPAAIQLIVSSDVSKMAGDVELIMRVTSDIDSKGSFYTDSNGLQLLKRKFVSDLPVQGNYYPANTAVFIEDSDVRLSVLLSHSHGVTSTDGMIEIMLDRKIRYDDGRGIGEGIEDSREVSSVFWLLPESRIPKQSNVHLTSTAFLLSLVLLNPLTIFLAEYSEMDRIKNNLSFLDESWPSDVHLVNLRSFSSAKDYNLPSNDSLMIIQQRSSSCSSNKFLNNFIGGEKQLFQFSLLKIKSLTRTLLTGTSPLLNTDNVNKSSFPILQAFKISFGAKN